ncbi:GNAT family N-acetyltransferase [Oceaniserpentilla sp. 4NH20-0058]|uniref:GNAT family N-acetyltransferase n=1 Tax=Oceaniserpentilla sp. 4NH20-0058 TaxID=3127660 RepID=UPI00310C30AC
MNQAAKLQPITQEVSLSAHITNDPMDIQSAFELRHQVFTQEFGAELHSEEPGIDKDEFDEYCYHLVVKEQHSQRVVAYSRIITSDMARQHNGFYTAGEFKLDGIMDESKRYMEIGRTCVSDDHRSGSAIALLWGQIGQFMLEHNIDCLIGCASIPFINGSRQTLAVIDYLRTKHFTDASKRVIPKHTLPQVQNDMDGKHLVPALLKAYLRMGCKVCGEAHWDKAFNVADVMVLLEKENINMRYLKHFLRA